MKFLVLALVVLGACCAVQGKTLEQCIDDAKKCKAHLAPLLSRGGNSREAMLRAIRTTPIDDICSALQGFVQCGSNIVDGAECKDHETIKKYQPLKLKFQKFAQFVCVDNKAAFARAIPCLTTRQFFSKITQCKRSNPCNSDASWGCAGNAVRSQCDSETYNFFEANWRKFQASHPGCGDDNPMKKLFGAMRSQ